MRLLCLSPRRLALAAALAIAAPIAAQVMSSASAAAPAKAPLPVALGPIPTEADVYFKSAHDPCIISDSQLTEGTYTVKFSIKYGDTDNTVSTKANAHFEVVRGVKINHIFVDYPLDRTASCPSLTFTPFR